MSLNAKRTYTVLDQTALVARAIFPGGNQVTRFYDDLHMVVANRDFADLFPTWGQPTDAPVRLALATLLQFIKPNLITNVETTNASVSDDAVTSTIHMELEARNLLPKTPVADTGFVNSALFIDVQSASELIWPAQPAATGSGKLRLVPGSLRATLPLSGRRVLPERLAKAGHLRLPSAQRW